MAQIVSYEVSFYDEHYGTRRDSTFKGMKEALAYATEKHDEPERYKRIKVYRHLVTTETKRIQ